MFTFQTQARHGYSVQFSPFYAQRLACATSQHYGIAGSGRLFVLDFTPGHGIQPIRVLDWNSGLFDVTWSEDNENVLVTGSGDGSLQVWDAMQPAAPLKVLKDHTRESLLDTESSLIGWFGPTSPDYALPEMNLHRQPVYSVHWSQTRNEHFIISASWDRTIKLWDIHKENPLSTCTGHDGLVYSAVWSPHIPGCVASVSGDQTLRVWDLRNPEAARMIIPAHSAEILTCDWAKYDQNILFTGSVDAVIRGWDIRRGDRCLCELTGHHMAVRRLKTSPHVGSVLASTSYDFTVSVQKYICQQHVDGRGFPLGSAWFPPTIMLAAVVIWDTSSKQCIDNLEHHSEFVYGLDFNLHTSGQLADCGWDELVRVYSVPSCLPKEPP